MVKKLNQSVLSNSKKQLIAVLVILALGVGAGAYLLRTEKPNDDGHGHGAAAHSDSEPKEGAATKGPKGGKLFVEAGYGLEMTIFETGVEPEFVSTPTKIANPLRRT